MTSKKIAMTQIYTIVPDDSAPKLIDFIGSSETCVGYKWWEEELNTVDDEIDPFSGHDPKPTSHFRSTESFDVGFLEQKFVYADGREEWDCVASWPIYKEAVAE